MEDQAWPDFQTAVSDLRVCGVTAEQMVAFILERDADEN